MNKKDLVIALCGTILITTIPIECMDDGGDSGGSGKRGGLRASYEKMQAQKEETARELAGQVVAQLNGLEDERQR